MLAAIVFMVCSSAQVINLIYIILRPQLLNLQTLKEAQPGRRAERTKPLKSPSKPQAWNEEAVKRQEIIRDYILMSIRKKSPERQVGPQPAPFFPVVQLHNIQTSYAAGTGPTARVCYL